jgi:hypothetical protein
MLEAGVRFGVHVIEHLDRRAGARREHRLTHLGGEPVGLPTDRGDRLVVEVAAARRNASRRVSGSRARHASSSSRSR